MRPPRTRPCRRRLGTFTAIATAVALMLSGCSLVPSPKVTSKPVTTGVAGALRPFYGQRLVWSQCANGFQCATATAPLDWAHPAGARIHLAVTRLPATGKRLGSMFVNPGGPGDSGVTFLQQEGKQFFDAALREHYDLVAWDPRGVGASSAVECEGTAGLDQFLFADPDDPTGSAALRRALTAPAIAFGKACAAKTGALLAHVDTESTVRDLDMLRAAVGDKKLTYFGFSYGTLIGAEYADRYPTLVGRMALDGTIDPSIDEFQQNLANTKAFGAALKAYLAHCLAGAKCPFAGQTVDQAIDTIAALLVRLRQSPIRAPDGREVNSAYLRTAINASLYTEKYWPYLTDALTEIQRGVTTYTLALADSYVDRENGKYTDNLFEAIYAVNCLDDPVERDPAVLAAQGRQLDAADPLRAADNSNALGDLVCANWPVKATGAPHRVRAIGSPPILVIGTTGDPATPYPWAVSVAKQLPKGVLITYRGQGHTAYRDHVACVNTPADRYFTAGIVPKSGLTCK